MCIEEKSEIESKIRVHGINSYGTLDRFTVPEISSLLCSELSFHQKAIAYLWNNYDNTTLIGVFCRASYFCR